MPVKRYAIAATLLAFATAVVAGGTNASDVARGHHLATVMGCTSCHGAKLDGHLFQEDPQFAVAWSSNLSRTLPRWTDAQVDATLRTGKRPDGTPLWFMPTFAHRHLSPADMRDLIAWLRTIPPTGTDHPAIQRGPQFAAAQAHGFQDSAAQALRLADRNPVDMGAKFARGQYLVQLACAECHGPDVKGPRDPQPGDAPDLAVAAAYPPAAFARLVRGGVKADGTPAGDMAEEARKRLSALSDAELTTIRAYLVARAQH